MVYSADAKASTYERETNKASANPAPLPDWVTWPTGVAYLSRNAYDARVPKEVVKLHRSNRQPPTAEERPGSCANVRIGRLKDTRHPAFGQHGLFAARKLASGTHVCDYRGVVTLLEHESATSDYTLAFVESDVRLTLDALSAGNEGRFINDFRGHPTGKQRSDL
jgi:hypothetical protein